MSFQHQVVIVTGGAQGIGRGVSQRFAQVGAHVVIADLDRDAGLEHETRLRDLGYSATYIPMDVREEADVKHVVAETVRIYGAVHILINNAGVGWTGSLLDRSMEEWDRVIAINLRGPYMMTKYCVPELMKHESPGVVINMASTRALMSEPNTEPYSASKGGILALTHSLAVSLGPKIRVNAISPGWIEVVDWKKAAVRTEPHHSEADLSQHPAGRVGHPYDIAEACLFLASPAAGFITGQNFVIDGGMSIKMIYEP